VSKQITETFDGQKSVIGSLEISMTQNLLLRPLPYPILEENSLKINLTRILFHEINFSSPILPRI